MWPWPMAASHKRKRRLSHRSDLEGDYASQTDREVPRLNSPPVFNNALLVVDAIRVSSLAPCPYASFVVSASTQASVGGGDGQDALG